VTIEFEHRATSVRLSATYDDPRRAVSAIGVFRKMVGVEDGEATPVEQAQAESDPAGVGARELDVRGQAARAPGQAASVVQRQGPSGSATAALTTNGSAGVPMGIRYTKGAVI
jgi:hypothetical protein